MTNEEEEDADPAPPLPQLENIDEFADLDLTELNMGLFELTQGDATGTRPNEKMYSFYAHLVQEPRYAALTSRFKAIVNMYARRETVQTICETLGVSRAEVALTVQRSGIRRGMDSVSMAPEDAANLYALLYAAQLEIEELRAQLHTQ